MFISLLIVTFLIALIVSGLVGRFFSQPVERILGRIVEDDIRYAWTRYLTFAIYVVGISGGVRIFELEKYITSRYTDSNMPDLNLERWVLEVYRTIIETLQSIAWLLFSFFVFALIAYVIVRIAGKRHQSNEAKKKINE
ncbi:conserved hypothetical protein [Chloroherpeton thalassium ATCC 35110]|uniref:Uncharacterized protein n=1 Tax=Chloroherpeton thalassium (strain ATCC 35110 / GB-78) TaxID=517418 RepID=B3QUJ1_CHLT3|nr:hypothetical protein [Chloroherpeton thalassium]ACF12897.1 conserved hypothetical protein [Chloroherpeton thalassium ATCC 35110]